MWYYVRTAFTIACSYARLWWSRWARSGAVPVTAETEWSSRVLLCDIDYNLHLNNSQFLTLFEFARWDFFIRVEGGGIVREAYRNGWCALLGCLQRCLGC
eukprot:TRINITY_DN2843_c0_g1_i3.p1 TRINITY_DN2843_c0_g1~~TRINITY_DN2843_c0_g1_i3.p1  ORF type:complete len:100 (+),score=20.54 TRINITY_DN2843_c0_g1_i3:40-339(+)